MCGFLGKTSKQEVHAENQASENKEPVPPVPLPHAFCSSLDYMRSYYKETIPVPLQELVLYMDHLDRTKTPYLFKNEVKNMNIRKLLDHGNQGIELKPANAHEACTLIKLFFKGLPEPIIPSSLINSFEWLNSQEQAAQFRLIMKEKIPPYNARVLIYLLKFIDRVINHKDENQMGAFELATEFNNILCWPDGGRITNESMYHTFFFTEYMFSHRRLIIS